MKDQYNQIVMEPMSHRSSPYHPSCKPKSENIRLTIIQIQGHNIKADEILRCEKRFHTHCARPQPYLWLCFKNNLIQTFNYFSESQLNKDYKKVVNFLDKLTPVSL